MSNSIQNVYPVFENSQVLTSQQLNELRSYLDQQTRLTRTRLIGIGTVCGLQQNFDSVTNTLTISAGTGVTSEGYLIVTGDCEFTKYRDYVLPPSLVYTPFIDKITNTQIPMYELLRSDYVAMTGEIIGNLNATFVNGTNDSNVMFVMLFLEMVDVSNDACLGKSCDTAGFERTFTLRKLLITKANLLKVIANTGPYDLTFNGKFDLPDILSQRPLFDPNLSNSRDYFAFSQDFRDAAASVYKRNSTNPKDIIVALRKCFTVFQPILQPIYGTTNPFADGNIPNQNIWDEIMNGVNSVTNGPSYFGIQYFYDFLRDLILAYNEFRDAAFELFSDCCFDERLFPMHLILGEATPLDPDRPSAYRDDFVGVPLTPEQRTAKAALICYFNRMVLMVRMFDVNRIHKHDLAALPPTFITPSFEKFGKLSKRAVPYYYRLNDVDPQLGKLEKYWNFENIARNKDVAGEWPVIAYGNQSNNQTVAIDPIQTPNFYDLDPYNFYRIEGCLAKDKDAVLTDLKNKRAQFDLPFNVVAVRLQGSSNPDDILARCNFNDLRSQYVAYRNELYCSIQKLFDHFFESNQSAEGVPGAVGSSSFIVKKVPNFLKQLLQDTITPTGQGNSSATFLPAYFALPGQSLPRFIPPIQYAPTPTNQVTSAISSTYLPALMDRLIQLSLLLPDQLDDFDFGYDNIANTDSSFIGSYMDAVSLCNIIKALLNELLDQITHSTRNRFTPEMYAMLTQWLNEEFYFLNEFITDCKVEKIKAVFYELQYRIRYLQTNDPTVFSNFITRNPGIQHMAGVAPGGTFVVVYPGESLNFTPKIHAQITAQLEMIQALRVRKGELQAIQGKTPAQVAEMASVDSQLCNLYEAQVSHPLPFGLSVAGVAELPIQLISLGADEVIADFTLPYLSNCECECDDIPAPTSAQLALPAIAMPAMYEFFPGDYAFAKDLISSTFGCTQPAQLLIDIRSNTNYDTINVKEGIFKLKFVVNGDSQNRQVNTDARATVTTATTLHGGTVIINTNQANYDQFIYTPPVSFYGIDSFEYLFEIYDRSNNILLHSNKAKVTISVTPRCKPAASAVANNTSIEGTQSA
ncbi:MAG TPA: hypothetical protein VL651_07000 [Bacteroidia bacterium]|jgi:hypothetical protein|nr:hypothetical protein [Bacteroidia bacterium]